MRLINPMTTPKEISIPLPKLSVFIRQIAHDLRNGLNAIDLEAAYVAEIVTEEEASAELKKLRAMVATVAKNLQDLSGYFGTLSLTPMEIDAHEFAEALRERIASQLGEKAAEVEWKPAVGEAPVEVDFELIAAALTEILRNAFQFREGKSPIVCTLTFNEAGLRIEVREKKAAVPSDPAGWGGEPLSSTRRGAYGLGLFQAQRIVQAHGGILAARHEDGELLTQFSLPAKLRMLE